MELFVWLYPILFFSTIHPVQGHDADIRNLLPAAEEITGWMAEDESQIAVGEDLYIMINGGAEIYHEYGFKQALYQTYSDANGYRINLEIYEMENSDAAYGMFTFKTNAAGNHVKIGSEGWISSYYLNFWKGPYVVTLIGLDMNEIISNGLIHLAGVIDAKIQAISQMPPITAYIPAENIVPRGLTYIKGNLALVNQYPFTQKNIFNCAEGVIGRYPGYSLFLLQYANDREAQTWFSFSMKAMKESERFIGFQNGQDFYTAKDNKENILIIELHRKWIMIFIGSQEKDGHALLKSLRSNLPA